VNNSYDLERFVRAEAPVIDDVMEELRQGCQESRWCGSSSRRSKAWAAVQWPQSTPSARKIDIGCNARFTLPLCCGRTEHMEKTIRKYTDFEEIKADEYRYWQSRPAHERLDAVETIIETAYALKGWEIKPEVPRLQRPFIRIPVPWR
jgi:hypothetical protein